MASVCCPKKPRRRTSDTHVTHFCIRPYAHRYGGHTGSACNACRGGTAMTGAVDALTQALAQVVGRVVVELLVGVLRDVVVLAAVVWVILAAGRRTRGDRATTRRTTT